MPQNLETLENRDQVFKQVFDQERFQVQLSTWEAFKLGSVG